MSSMLYDGLEVQAVLLAAAILLASGQYTTREAVLAARCLRAELRCQEGEVRDANQPF
jgi:hypothetical protein